MRAQSESALARTRLTALGEGNLRLRIRTWSRGVNDSGDPLKVQPHLGPLRRIGQYDDGDLSVLIILMILEAAVRRKQGQQLT